MGCSEMSKKLLSVVTSIALSASLFSTGLVNNVAAETAPSYSGEEIFKGVIAGQGEAAAEFDSIWSAKDLKKANKEANVEIIDNVIDIMGENNPDYFVNLEESLEAKDLKKTEDLLQEGSTEFLEILDKEYGSKIEKGVVDTNCLILALSMGAILTHAAAITFYLYVVAAGPGLNSAGDDTSREQVVLDMVETYNN